MGCRQSTRRQLLRAAYAGDVTALKKAIAAEPLAVSQARDGLGFSAMGLAAYSGQTAAIQELLQAGASVDEPVHASDCLQHVLNTAVWMGLSLGSSVLIMAAVLATVFNTAIVPLFIAGGGLVLYALALVALPNGSAAIPGYSWQRLVDAPNACCCRAPKQVQVGDTPLHIAVRQGHMDAVQFLLQVGASPLATNRIHQTVYGVAKTCLPNGHGVCKLLSSVIPRSEPQSGDVHVAVNPIQAAGQQDRTGITRAAYVADSAVAEAVPEEDARDGCLGESSAGHAFVGFIAGLLVPFPFGIGLAMLDCCGRRRSRALRQRFLQAWALGFLAFLVGLMVIIMVAGRPQCYHNSDCKLDPTLQGCTSSSPPTCKYDGNNPVSQCSDSTCYPQLSGAQWSCRRCSMEGVCETCPRIASSFSQCATIC